MEQPWWIDHQARDLVAVGLNKSALQELGQLNFIDVALVGTQLKTNDSLATDSDDGQWLIKVQPFS